MACLYRRGRIFWISYYIGDKQIKKSLNTTNERLARSKLKKVEYDLALGDLHVASKLPLPSILEAFCRELMASRTGKSYKNDLSRLRVFFGPICDVLKPGLPGILRSQANTEFGADKYAGKHVKAELLEDITTSEINRFIAARIEQDGWSAKTANLMRQTIHKLFSYAIKHHDFRSRDRRYPNPASGVQRRREPAPNIRFLSLDEINQQLMVLNNYPLLHTVVATFIYAGLRREEGIWLTREDVDMKNRLIRVRAKNIEGEFWQPKTKRNRVVPISEALFDILDSYEPFSNCVWFFPSPTGKRWDPDNFSQDLRKINKVNGLDWSCLDFRHTFGSHLAQKGVSLYQIATLMGNSPEICRRHYAALIPEKMAEVVEFSDNKPSKTEDQGTKEMLQEILRKLNGADDSENQVPHLKLVKPENSA